MNLPAKILLSAKSPYSDAGEGDDLVDVEIGFTVVFIRGLAKDSRSMETTLEGSPLRCDVDDDVDDDVVLLVLVLVEEEVLDCELLDVSIVSEFPVAFREFPRFEEGFKGFKSNLAPEVSERDRFLD